jgi:hypothetical protein
MQATKLKGIVNQEGKLIIEEPINLSPGEVEVVILQMDNLADLEPAVKPKQIKYRTQAFRDLLEQEEPVGEDFDVDSAKWSYLQEKYNL